MWRTLVLAVAACSSSHGGADAPGDPVVCKAALETALDRSCSAPSDRVLVASEDCCGTVMLGVRTGTTSGFAQAEATYVACLACGARGCQHADLAEDGMAAGVGQTIVATCVASRCTSTVQ